METPELVVDFYGVYLLRCVNPKYLGRTYIGYTRDPTRRLKQHNRGTWAGGAWRTNNRGPWKMALIVHGFPNNIAALRFEWAWQHPDKTTRLQHVVNIKKIRKESEFQHKLRILAEMLRVGPWYRLPLTVQWLEREYYEDFPIDKTPPNHMTVKHGTVKSKNNYKKLKGATDLYLPHAIQCYLCTHPANANNSTLKCSNSNCHANYHIICLGNIFLNNGDYIPIVGNCPKCDVILKWGDLIKALKCGGADVQTVDSDDDVELSQGCDDIDSWQDGEYLTQDDEMLSQVDDILPQIDNLSQNDDELSPTHEVYCLDSDND